MRDLWDDKEVSPAPKANPNIVCPTLFSDESLMAIDKAAGIVTQPGMGHREDTMMNGLFATHRVELTRVGEKRDWGLLHRLDRETSGVVLVARSQQAYDLLRRAFENRLIDKTYLAVVQGRLPRDQGTCRQPLEEVRRGDMKVSVPAQRGEEAITHWRILAKSRDKALVAVAIETGKLHQIRSHLAFLGAPVEGEKVYRSLLPPNTSANPAAGRRGSNDGATAYLRLHAWSVSLTHPATGKPIRIEAPLPPPMEESARSCCTKGGGIDGLLASVRAPRWWDAPQGKSK